MVEPSVSDRYPPLSPFLTGPLGRCPRCGKGALFSGFLALRGRCEVCDLDLTGADTGDGPSFFASLLGSIVVIGIGVVLQVAYDPPVWAYVVLVVLGALFIVALIRPLKGLLAALQFTNKAAEGRFDP